MPAMWKPLFVLALAAAGCGGKNQPPAGDPGPQPTAPGAPGVMTPEECTAKGGQVKGDIGDGKVACDATQRDLGRVNQGIEGAVCCAPQSP